MKDVIRNLKKVSSAERAKNSARFFKTGPGQYGEGDKFIGVNVPDQRKVSREFYDLPLSEIDKLLSSPIHELRLTALFILNLQYKSAIKKGPLNQAEEIVTFYLDHLDHVNNWDLVDSSAPYILGDWIVSHPDQKPILIRLADSGKLWSERVAVIATAPMIRAGDFEYTLKFAKQFLTHKHDLIHKVTGWMLREIGNRDQKTLTEFLNQHAVVIPRTMLRYAIEKLPSRERQQFLARR